jgi:hypothetical protein
MESNEGIKEAIKGGKGMPRIALLIFLTGSVCNPGKSNGFDLESQSLG